MMTRDLSLLLLALAVLAIRHAGGKSPADGSRPNIVLMLADDLGIGDLGCYGNTTLATPNIDSLARDGAKMTQYLTAAAICTPSRAALLTGRYPIRLGLSGANSRPIIQYTSSRAGLAQQEVTFAEVAKKAGYRTALVGKWHLGLHQNWPGDNVHNPRNQGFDYFFGIPLTNLKNFDDEEIPVLERVFPRARLGASLTNLAGVLVAAFLWRKNYIGPWTCLIICIAFTIVPQVPIWVGSHMKLINSMLYRDFELVEQPMDFTGLTKRLVQEGVNFLEDQKEDGPPFLLFMSWLQVHTVLHAGPAFRGASKYGLYGDEVMELDWSVGKILKALDRLGMRENTMVLFSSDHGGHVEGKGKNGDVQGGYNGIYRGGKFQGGMDGGIRVPGLIRWPSHIAPQTQIDVPLSMMDFLPTVAEAVGVEPPVVDGVSMLPILTGETEHTTRDYLIHYCSSTIHAVRFKPDQDGAVWKVRYTTPKWLPGTEGCLYGCLCTDNYYTTHEQPLVFDMVSNPREDKPLPTTDSRYSKLVKAAEDAIKEHQSSLEEVEDQLSFANWIFRPYLMPCCNFPFCSCKDKKQHKFK